MYLNKVLNGNLMIKIKPNKIIGINSKNIMHPSIIKWHLSVIILIKKRKINLDYFLAYCLLIKNYSKPLKISQSN